MENAIERIYLCLSTRSLSRSQDHLREWLGVLCSKLPTCSPAEFQFSGRRFHRFSPAAFDARLEEFVSGFIWKRQESGVDGDLHLGRRGEHSSLSMKFQSTLWPTPDLIDAATTLMTITSGDIAFLHALSPEEVRHASERELAYHSDRAGKKWFYDVPSRRLLFGLPDLAWTTLFGPVYVKHFGRDRLLSAPAHRVAEVASDVVLVQLTETYQQILTDWARFDSVRSDVLAHLGRDSFQRVRRPDDPPPETGRGVIFNEGIPARRVPNFDVS